MKYLGALIMLIALMNPAYARLIVVADQGNTVAIDPFIQALKLPTAERIQGMIRQRITEQAIPQIKTRALLYPSQSQFTPGHVSKHQLARKHFTAVPIFVLGNDPYSRQWAKKNANYLKQIHAFGIVTNVSNAEQVEKIEQATGLKLTPASLSGFASVVATQHYPFLIYQGWVLQ